MQLAHDPDLDFYYVGEEEPRAGLYRELVEGNHKLISVDVETISLKERIATGVGISFDSSKALYFPLFPKESAVVPWKLLRDPGVVKVYHNSLFDILCLREYDMDYSKTRDTNVMAQLLNIRPSRLYDLTAYMFINHGKYMQVKDMGELLKEHKARITLDLPKETVAMKCCQDAMATLEVYNFLLPKMDKDYYLTEMEVIPTLVNMSHCGMAIDQEARYVLELKLQKEVDTYLQLAEEMGFNPASAQQVGYMLAKRGAYRIFNKIPFNRGGRSIKADVEVLSRMDDPLANMVLSYRACSKLLSTYIRPWANESRAYTRFHLDAITGRPSSTDRNLQNIPQGEPRGIFIPDNGCFTDVDFSQLELRVLAYLSQDLEMQYILNNPNGDIHQATADFLGIDRRPAKTINFAMVYGATDSTIAEQAHVSVQRAGEWKKGWFEKYKQAGSWIEYQQEKALVDGYITTVFGRKIALPTLDEETSDGIMRKAIDYPCQGSAAEIAKRALIRCKHLPMVLMVHDELLFDSKIPKEEFDSLEHIAPFWTPVGVKYLLRWE